MSGVIAAQAQQKEYAIRALTDGEILNAFVYQLKSGHLNDRIKAAKAIQSLLARLTQAHKDSLAPKARDAFIYVLDQRHGLYNDPSLRTECIKGLVLIGDKTSVSRIIRMTRGFGSFGRDECPRGDKSGNRRSF